MTKEITNAPKHSFPSIGREDVAHTEEMEHKIRRTDSEVCFDFLNHLLKIKMCAPTCGEGEQDSLTQRGCRQTMYIQMKARSLNLLRTKCTEMCSDRATRPAKAASGVEAIPTLQEESKRLGWNFLRLPEVSFKRGPATPSRRLLSTGKHARVPAGAGGGGPASQQRHPTGDRCGGWEGRSPPGALRPQRAER